jgi:hypothetical protein
LPPRRFNSVNERQQLKLTVNRHGQRQAFQYLFVRGSDTVFNLTVSSANATLVTLPNVCESPLPPKKNQKHIAIQWRLAIDCQPFITPYQALCWLAGAHLCH